MRTMGFKEDMGSWKIMAILSPRILWKSSSDFTGLHNGIAGKDSQNGLAGDGLAGAGLTHDGQGFAPGKVEVNSPDRLHLAVAGAERDT